jgi:hypothetical protein
MCVYLDDVPDETVSVFHFGETPELGADHGEHQPPVLLRSLALHRNPVGLQPLLQQLLQLLPHLLHVDLDCHLFPHNNHS